VFAVFTVHVFLIDRYYFNYTYIKDKNPEGKKNDTLITLA
jgi:hypothetical protein